jgi:hypothetical protein
MTLKMIGIYNFKQIGYFNFKLLIYKKKKKKTFSMEADFREVFVLLLLTDEIFLYHLNHV